MKKEAKAVFESMLFIVVGVALVITLAIIVPTAAETSGSSGNASLTISDATDNDVIRLSNQNISFYANFTNSSYRALNSTNGNGLCQIQFNFTGTFTAYTNMTFNSTSLRFDYNRSFNYKGTHQFNVSCTSNFGNVTLNESFKVTNTAPLISTTAGGTYIDFDDDTGTNDYWGCTEDVLCTYNLSANVTDPDLNDILTYENVSQNTTLTRYTFNTTTGMLTVNITDDTVNGSQQIRLQVTDSDLGLDSKILRVNITPVNDAPQLLNLGGNRTLNKSAFELILRASDEENDVPFTFNRTFIQCAFTSINPPTGPNNCTLFNLTAHNNTATNISFTPADNQKGQYRINFSVTDNRGAIYYEIVNWTLTWNDPPYFTYVCDNERNTTENAVFTCQINASDPDELNNLTFTANYTWFSFNGTTLSNSTTITTSGGNASAVVNFTATDSQVGNWSVNVSVRDTGATNSSAITNSTVFYFFIANVNDSVTLDSINNVTAYTSNNYTIYVNATDNDLLIPDERVYNESVRFASNNSNLNITATGEIAETNKTQATIQFNPNNLGIGNHSINISVNDSNGFSRDSRVFVVTVLGNNPPAWNAVTNSKISMTEDVAINLNLSQNVTDPENDPINFTYSNDTAFPSFSLGTTTGIVSFTPIDTDVGQHLLQINVTDGVTPSPFNFNFTVQNVNDNPNISSLTANGATVNSSTFNTNTTEDSTVILTLLIDDDDFRIPSNQKGFYNETIILKVTITGQNTTLFSFSQTGDFPTQVFPQRVEFETNSFTPRKADVGNYTIRINATDFSNVSSTISFNFTIAETQHVPNMTKIGAVNSSVIETLYLDFNVTDLEEGNETSSGANLTYSIRNLTANGNFLSINTTTGIINFTLNQTYAGVWRFNISVNDSTGRVDSEAFNISVYDYPLILLPTATFQFNLVENISALLNFTVNHTVQDTLNHTIVIRGVIRNSTSGNGNGTVFLWNFTANFTDQTTCLGPVNLTLNVSNPKLSNATTWNLTVNQSNSPLTLSTSISDQSGGSPITITLSNHFSDTDASDSCINQTIGFTATKMEGGDITVTIQNWTNAVTPSAQFSSSASASANYSITAYQFNDSNAIISNVTSNNFSVTITVSTTTTPTSGGGGSSTPKKIISLKIIVPAPVSAKKKDKIVVPIGVVNDGTVTLNKIILDALVAKNGFLRTDLIASFDRSFLSVLTPGQREDVTMIVDIDTTETGLFEITINGTVRDPKYSDWGKFYIEVEEEEDILERIVFTEEFIIGNPECAELKEVVDEARFLYNRGDLILSRQKIEEALEACRIAIEQPITKRAGEIESASIITYAAIASVIAMALGFVYYHYKKIRLRGEIQNRL